ncbi:hypothetical protein [Burkholderia cenocepacia]|uniref:hypothetical protein n=1 Tax=Burkholderia cenocepacia TaxID=95486 RepID=UPI002B24D2B4|nr:hypothetical protein [Burkholderia cenocepacia]MEB2558770.1 hypothetical protein [Burkholderia cenocepacia]
MTASFVCFALAVSSLGVVLVLAEEHPFAAAAIVAALLSVAALLYVFAPHYSPFGRL